MQRRSGYRLSLGSRETTLKKRQRIFFICIFDFFFLQTDPRILGGFTRFLAFTWEAFTRIL